MEALEGVVVGELKDLSQQIVKGKRTKRLRISSPTPFAVASTHVSSYEGVGCSNNEENTTVEDNDNDNNNNNNDNLNSTDLRLSPPFSSDDDNSSTMEDEEIARLLILLSQGNPRESSTQNDYLDHNYSPPSPKFTSKKYIETSFNGNGKSGMYVYECKTCNRTFSSFQALGGHRASHKKPRNLAIEEIKKRPYSSVFLDDYDYDFHPSQLSFARKTSHSNLASPVSYHSMMSKSLASPKIHECSYCGAEFTSGQALGGHMRRHRGSNGNNNNNKNKFNYYNNHNNSIRNIQPLLDLSPSFSSLHSTNPDFVGVKKQKINHDSKDALSLSLSLDLNLPAPPQAENSQKNQESTEFGFVKEEISSPSPQQQNEQQTDNEPALLLSTSQALVVCPD